MHKIKFGDFMEASYPDRYDQDAWLYVVRNGSNVLYVGVTRSGIHNRWFGSGFSHMYYERFITQTWNGNSSIGSYVANNLPGSREWIIEFWTSNDLYKYFKPNRRDVWQEKQFEVMMIRKRKPVFNVTFNKR
jgi:hypothetical protein